MGRGEPELTVWCDKCGDEIVVGLTSTARGGYDERNVDADIVHQHGWSIEGGDFCEDCARGGE